MTGNAGMFYNYRTTSSLLAFRKRRHTCTNNQRYALLEDVQSLIKTDKGCHKEKINKKTEGAAHHWQYFVLILKNNANSTKVLTLTRCNRTILPEDKLSARRKDQLVKKQRVVDGILPSNNVNLMNSSSENLWAYMEIKK